MLTHVCFACKQVMLAMPWELKHRLKASCSMKEFYSGMEVWVRRPNVVNRKLLGAMVRLEGPLSSSWVSKDPTTCDHVTVKELLQQPGQEDVVDGSKVVVRELLPRSGNVQHPTLEVVVMDCSSHSVSFCQLKLPSKGKLETSEEISEAQLCPEVSYRFVHEGHASTSKVSLYTAECYPELANGVTSPGADWLGGVLLPKILQWAQEGGREEGPREPLIPLDRYCSLYQEMKDRYGHTLIKNWPENTDPYKFVYEDIAIATYLLVLWEEERKKLHLQEKQSFVDLGCGNGLLVYLLTSEGHRGKGLDLRERKIWKMFGPKIDLQVCALTPSATTLFPSYDWLLGNHSDELTPWLPVMAARSSYTTRFFVLPCCTHDFNRKFRRVGSGKSQYRFYLDYVVQIGERMGFKVQEDVLRIPSSKRVCLIGQQRTYQLQEEADVDTRRQAYVKERCGMRSEREECGPSGSDNRCCQGRDYGASKGSSQECGAEFVREGFSLSDTSDGCVDYKAGGGCGSREEWDSGFVPRASREPVRNCSQVNRDVSQLIVATIAGHLLTTTCLVAVQQPGGGGGGGPPTHLSAKWNRGGRLHLSEAAQMFGRDVLTQLKREYGGLQTLLRTWPQVFHVHGGFIHLRNWASSDGDPVAKKLSQREVIAKELLLKTKPCWFHQHHPQGCPRRADDCPYAHGLGELKQRPDFTAVLNSPDPIL